MNTALQRILPLVQKPARYTGGEYNEIQKNPADVRVRVAFCLPDNYEIGMYNVGMRKHTDATIVTAEQQKC